jgi:hypothetical protein
LRNLSDWSEINEDGGGIVTTVATRSELIAAESGKLQQNMEFRDDLQVWE